MLFEKREECKRCQQKTAE